MGGGYADDDQDWPSVGSNENSLGRAVITIDPADPNTLGQRQLGPTRTDNDNQGYVINLSIEVLSTKPDLALTGVEVTQAIQYFRSSLGPDNSLPLVAQKDTLVRAYIDLGLDPSSPSGGQVPNVTGTLIVMGSSNLSLTQLAPITAQPISKVNPAVFTDTLNFLIPGRSSNWDAQLNSAGSRWRFNEQPISPYRPISADARALDI